MEDVITNPTHRDRYKRIKAEVIGRMSVSEEQRVRQLLMHQEMGDWTPTQFLRHLRTLAGPSVPSYILRNLWASRLPQNIQAIIATQAHVVLEDVAQLADKIVEVTPPSVRSSRSAGRSAALDICWYHRRFNERAKR